MSEMKLKASTWNGKQEEAPIYLTKLVAMAECSGLGEVIKSGVTIMSSTAFAPDANKARDYCKKFMVNRKAGALFVLGQESPHGLRMLQDTIFTTNPHGKISNVLAQIEENF